MPLRVRLALVVALASAGLVASGLLLFTHQIRSGLLDSTDQALEAEAAPIASYLARASSVDSNYLGGLLVAQHEALAQVRAPDGTTVYSSRGLVAGLPACPKCEDHADRGEVTDTLERHVFEAAPGGHGTGTDRFLATSVRRSEGTWLVLVGTSLEDVRHELDQVRGGLILGGGAAVILAAVGAWLLSGAALRPVERMRREVAALSEHDPEGSIKVPPTRDQLAALAGTMNNLLSRLQDALARERRFVADASHELRTPLAVLQTELELAARRHRSPEELSEAVSHAAAEAARLSRLANDLLFLARVDEGVPVLRAEAQELGPVVVGALAAWSTLAAARQVTVHTELEPQICALFDADRLRQALDNLLDNALRFAPPGSTLAIDAHCAEGFAVVRVADQGPGFPPSFLPHAFERFSRPDYSRASEAGGSGLGLAVTAAIARAHGGWVAARNREGGGAVMELAVPRAPG